MDLWGFSLSMFEPTLVFSEAARKRCHHAFPPVGISGPVLLWDARLCALSVLPAYLQELGSDHLVGGEEAQGPWGKADLDHMQYL